MHHSRGLVAKELPHFPKSTNSGIVWHHTHFHPSGTGSTGRSYTLHFAFPDQQLQSAAPTNLPIQAPINATSQVARGRLREEERQGLR